MKAAFAAYPFASGEQSGLGAIKGEHHALLRCRAPANTRWIIASVDADSTCRTSQPEAPRWDYLIAFGRESIRFICAEVHPAKPDQVDRVIAKLEWLESMIGESPPPERAYIWIPTKKNAISTLSAEAHRLAKRGILIRRPAFIDEL